MTDSRRLLKELLDSFLGEFIELFLPEVLEYISKEQLNFLSEEVFTDITAEDKRQKNDLLAQGKWLGKNSNFLIHLAQVRIRDLINFNRRESQTKSSKNYRQLFPERSSLGHPVILIHGFYSDSYALTKVSDYLKNLGKSVYSIDLTPNDGSIPIEDYAEQLSQFINSNFSPQQSLDLVGFSMGGLVCRYYLQRLGGLKRAENLVTVASPHQGTLTAHVTWYDACKQMRPESDFLQDLNSDEYTLNQINCTAIWNPLDFVILPAESSKLLAGNSVMIPCVHHSSVTEDERVFEAIAKALQPPLNRINLDEQQVWPLNN